MHRGTQAMLFALALLAGAQMAAAQTNETTTTSEPADDGQLRRGDFVRGVTGGHIPGVTCSPDTPDGFCDSGWRCIDGACDFCLQQADNRDDPCKEASTGNYILFYLGVAALAILAAMHGYTAYLNCQERAREEKERHASELDEDDTV